MRWWTRRLIEGGLLLATVLSVVLCTRRAVPPTVGVDSPAVATTLVMLGGSRGIIAEVLWWRIAELQREHRYAELVPLMDLLVALEPSSEDAWAYNAHNLAYNISVAHEAPEERWTWVKRGLELLERGLRIQPTSQRLLTAMGEMWEDKVGGALDRAAPYYQAHVSEVPMPEDAATFEARVGTKVDWASPQWRALYWYQRAGDSYRCLRVAMGLMDRAGDEAFVAYYVQIVRQAWEQLSDRERMIIRSHLLYLETLYPQNVALKQALQEMNV